MADYGAVGARDSANAVSDTFGGRCEKYFAELNRWEVWRSILLGQILSVLLCATGVISKLLLEYQVKAPTAQSFLNYVLLCLVFTTALACRPGEGGLLSVLRQRGWKYLFIAAADVEANYLVVQAYKYTTLASVQLLDCFTIPVVLILSWTVLKVRYQIIHIVGVLVCLVAIGCLVWGDADENDEPARDRITGDLMCMGGAFLYGLSNMAEEFVVKTIDCVEFLAMVGLFGSVINGVQLAAMEHEQVASIDWTEWRVVALLAAYTLTLFAFYVVTPTVMKVTGATAVNLSLLTADFYSLIIGVLMFQFKYHMLYVLSFILVMAGVVIFCARPALIYSQPFGARTSLPRTITTTTTATNVSSSQDIQYHLQSLTCPPPPPPPSFANMPHLPNMPNMPSQPPIPLPVYYHSAEATYGTYRRRRGGNEAKEGDYYQMTKNAAIGVGDGQVEEQTTAFDGRGSGQTLNIRGGLEPAPPTPAPERMLLGGRESFHQPSTRPLSPLESTFTQTVKLKLPPSPGPGMTHSSRVHLPHCTLPRPRAHKEVTFNPQATFQVYRRPSACYDGDEQL